MESPWTSIGALFVSVVVHDISSFIRNWGLELGTFAGVQNPSSRNRGPAPRPNIWLGPR